jgi:hypothetical protein
VASAALAARNVRLEMAGITEQRYPGAEVSSGTVPELRYPAARVGHLGGLGSAQLAASPSALTAVARARNRSVEEIWEETLAAWLQAEERPSMASVEPARQRRRTVWHEIDSTMLALRMG